MKFNPLNFVLMEILKPATHRLGSAVGIYLASLDAFTDGQLATLENASVIAAGFLVDLIVRKAL